MSVSLDYYRIFYYVGKTGSITAAANALFLTQPTISHAIQNLEKELGCTLFLRTKKGVLMTPEAKKLYSHISIACEQIRIGEEQLHAALQLSEGSVSIGATETVLHFYLIPWLKKYHSLYPNIKLKISNSNTPATLQALKQGILDFAVLVMNGENDYTADYGKNYENGCEKSYGKDYGDYHESHHGKNYKKDSRKTFQITRLEDFSDIFVGGTEYAFLAEQTRNAKQPVSLSQLTQYPLVCLEKNTCTRTFLDQILNEHQVQWSPDIELATTDLIMPMVTQNFGIGFIPEYFAQAAIEQQTAFSLPIVEKIPPRHICLVCTPTPHSAASEAFIRMLSGNE